MIILNSLLITVFLSLYTADRISEWLMKAMKKDSLEVDLNTLR